MQLLLDTHVLLWLLSDNARLGAKARRAIIGSTRCYMSAASVLELTVKSMLGKLVLPDDFDQQLRDQGLTELAVNAAHAMGLTNFAELARHEPFDRVLLAQAHAEKLTLLTADRKLLALNYSFVMDAAI